MVIRAARRLAHAAGLHGEHSFLIIYATVDFVTHTGEALGIISVFIVLFGALNLRREVKEVKEVEVHVKEDENA